MTPKTKIVLYWIATILVAFFMGTGGLSQIWQYYTNPHGIVPELNYPTYFFAILGVWKALGAYAFHILAPLLIAAITLASWALRPPSRTIVTPVNA